MPKGEGDGKQVGTKEGGWVKCSDGFWHTEFAVKNKDIVIKNKDKEETVKK